MEKLRDELDTDSRLVAAAKNLQSRMSDESAADATMFRECHVHSYDMHQRLTQMKPETASFCHASATDSINIRDCKFLAPATNLASASDSSSSETASLQHPAAASSTAASNLLRATKKLSYGSSLGLCIETRLNSSSGCQQDTSHRICFGMKISMIYLASQYWPKCTLHLALPHPMRSATGQAKGDIALQCRNCRNVVVVRPSANLS